MKKTHVLDAVTYDAVSDILTIPGTYKNDKAEAVRLSFFDFGVHGYIKLQPKVTPPPA